MILVCACTSEKGCPLLEFEIIARGFFGQDQLEISYDPTLSLPTNSALDEEREKRWQEKLASARLRQVPLYDGPLFRFVEARVQEDTLRLVVGNTGYKEYVTTREPAYAAQRPRQELGNPLAVCSVVETADEYILLDKRAGVDVYVGRYHVIGGFFERDLDLDGAGRPDAFAAMRREITEETGVLPTDIVAQTCLGLVYDLLTPHAELCFLTRLAIPLATALTRLPRDGEIKRLHSLPAHAEQLRAFLLQNHGAISATGEPNLLLYGAKKFGEAWLEEVLSAIRR